LPRESCSLAMRGGLRQTDLRESLGDAFFVLCSGSNRALPPPTLFAERNRGRLLARHRLRISN
jgi:hypothetical protein